MALHTLGWTRSVSNTALKIQGGAGGDRGTELLNNEDNRVRHDDPHPLFFFERLRDQVLLLRCLC